MNIILETRKYKDPVALWAVADANIHSGHGDVAWAVELLKRAIKRDKHNPALYVSLGDAYRRLIDGANAIKSYNKALAINPHLAEAMYRTDRQCLWACSEGIA